MIKVLRGEVSDKIFEKRHDELSTFGIGRDHTMKYWRRILRQLIAKHYVNVNYRVYNVLTVNARAKNLLQGQEHFLVRVEGAKQLSSRKVIDHDDLDDAEQRLFSQLRQWRREYSNQNALAAYNVFPDSTLIQIVKRKPRKPLQLAGISGIGEKRIERYGEAVCEIVGQWYQQEYLKESA